MQEEHRAFYKESLAIYKAYKIYVKYKVNYRF